MRKLPPLLLLALLICSLLAGVSGPAQAATACTPIPAGQHDYTIKVGSQTRSYSVYVPKTWKATRKAPVVYFFHGRLGNAADQMWYDNLPRQADIDGFLVVAPQAIGKQSDWNVDDGTDAAFILALKPVIANSFCIDTSREYAVGYSSGSYVTHVLACNDFGGFDGFGGAAESWWWDGCPNKKGFDYVGFHGTADPYVDFNGNAQFGYQPVESSSVAMAKTDGCSTAWPDSEVGVADQVTRFSWTKCTGGHHIDMYVMWGAGHIWPGAAYLPDLGPQANIDAVKIFSSTWKLGS